MKTLSIEKKISLLDDSLKSEVNDFIDFLISKKLKKHEKLNFVWEGKLKNLKENFTSTELQHKSLEWR